MRADRFLGGLLALLAALPGARAAAQAPLSAIDWLSDSVMTAPGMLVAPDFGLTPWPGPVAPPGLAPGEPPVAESAGVETITVTPLDRPAPDGIGLVDAAEVGLDPGLWGRSEPEELARLISAFPAAALPAVQARVRALLAARLDPPQGPGEAGLLLRARIDALLARGALPEAAALLELADGTRPEHFRRAFDVALLTGDEDAGCDRLRATPGIAPSFSVRIFCLARTGDWPAAALTLETARALGQVSPDEDLLLARFLDSDIADETSILALPPVPTPLNFRMLEAIGEAIPTASLPLAFAHSDLRGNAGWKAQVEAAERLARVGALPPERLMEIWLERAPAASGGVWDRIAAVQAVEAALVAQDRRALGQALPAAWAAVRAAGLAVALAEARGAAIAAALPGSAAGGEIATRLALLSADYERAATVTGATATDPATRFLADVARGRAPVAPEAAEALAAAVAVAFSEAPPDPPEEIARRIADDRAGEALLLALRPLADGIEADPAAVAQSLAELRRRGHEDTARRAALQLLILGERP